MIPGTSVCVYSNRTSFTTIAPFVPVLSSLRNLDSCAWSKAVWGWHKDCRYSIRGVSPNMALFWLDQCMGRMTRVFYQGVRQWEGMIYEIKIEIPGATLTRSIGEMFNAVYVEYSDNDTGAQATTSASTDATSIALYGRKEAYVAGGTSSTTKANALRAKYKRTHKNPPNTREIVDNAPGTANIYVTAHGYWITGTWQYYTSTTAGTQASALTIGDIATAECPFWSATQRLEATGLTLERRFPNRATAWEQMLTLAAQGTSNDLKYFLGVKDNRVLTGWEEPITLAYVKYPAKPGRYYDATGGFPIPWWMVEPGKWCQVELSVDDNMTVDTDNPRALLIGQCEYDAVTRTVKPSYGVDMPALPNPSAQDKAEAHPFSKPWEPWEWRQGYRAAFYQGKWIVQYNNNYNPSVMSNENPDATISEQYGFKDTAGRR